MASSEVKVKVSFKYNAIVTYLMIKLKLPVHWYMRVEV